LPDLTRKQRVDESRMEEEVARRNVEELTQEDMSKSMCLKVVGQRGDKRIMKGYNREARGHQRERSVERKTARNRTRTVERGGARSTTWGVSKDVAKWTRNDSVQIRSCCR
jgi:hypothetical protein